MGLSISSELVKLMGGQLQLESEIGRGSRFFFSLCIPRGVVPQVREAESEDACFQNGLDILLAEDNAVNQLVATRLLARRGHKVRVAVNGLEAVKAAVAHTFDFILMDNQMPELDGLEATKRIRLAGCRTPIIGLSANAMQGDEELFLEAGMNACLSKPFRPDQLFALLTRLHA